MIALISFFVVLVLSLLVVRIVTVALTLTGMSHQTARFQARSAWTGTGFTTTESEQVVGHPLRRRIISTLMVVRNAGLISAASTLVLSFASAGADDARIARLAWLIGGLVLLWLVAQSRAVDRWLARTIRRALERFTDLDVRDYAELLRLAGNYGIAEMQAEGGDWLAGRTLRELSLPEEGVLVLGIQRAEGDFIGAPRGETRIAEGDTLTLYGRSEIIARLDRRTASLEGQREHYRAARVQRRTEERQQDEPS
ncbi:MAG: TrkA C-terminal domain-containing protein [Phycisphaerales bacterium JB039]